VTGGEKSDMLKYYKRVCFCKYETPHHQVTTINMKEGCMGEGVHYSTLVSM